MWKSLQKKNLHHSLLLIALYNLTNQPMITLQIWQPDLNAINPFIVLLLLLFHLRGKLQYLINDIYSHLCTPEAQEYYNMPYYWTTKDTSFSCSPDQNVPQLPSLKYHLVTLNALKTQNQCRYSHSFPGPSSNHLGFLVQLQSGTSFQTRFQNLVATKLPVQMYSMTVARVDIKIIIN